MKKVDLQKKHTGKLKELFCLVSICRR